MGRIQRPLNYRPWHQRAADSLVAAAQSLRELGTPKQWLGELCAMLLLAVLFLVLYCLLP